ncbi:hypothetical protein AB0B50_30540 [Streptomyces sp. NPDC041068]|uniref:hypothetical protein n=1 Tax=Streptomyces sp. NPDC041068 TaxID=3155130 RepID=UPI0033CBF769
MRRISPRATATTALFALALTAVPATASAAEPPPPPAKEAKPAKDVPVDGGFVKLTLDAELLAGLKAKGVVLTQLTTDCKVPKDPKGKPYVPPVTALSLGVTAGDIAAVDAKVGGKLTFAKTCLGLVNVKTKAGVTLSGLEADLSTGVLIGTLHDAKGTAEVKLGTFERAALDKKTVDTAANSVSLNADVKVDAALAARLNAGLGVEAVAAGTALLTADTDLSLQADADLSLDLGLNVNTEVSTGLDLGVILGGLLGLK